MNFRPSMLSPAGPTALAQESDFALGNLSVSPSRLEVCAGEKRETIQPRVMQVLTLLARRRDEVVSRDDLIAICWGGRAVSEDAINRSIAGVRRLGDSSGEFLIETVRRVGYRLEQTASPFEAAAVVSSNSNNAVLAVLAFDNLSGDAEMAYFSDGVSEEILQTVAAKVGIKVIGRGSRFQFRGADKAASRVAAALKTTHILDGSVRRSGARVRIATNLIECRSATTLWTERFERDLSDVFAVQDEIAAAVAAALKVTLGPIAQRSAVDPAAYDLYLRALETRNRGLDAGTRLKIIALLRKATELSPGFARAWAFLATMQAGQLRFDEPEQTRGFSRNDIVAAAETALALDAGLGAAWQALAYLEPLACYEKRDTLQRKALSAAPNDPTVLTNASFFFAEIGSLREALGYARRAYEIDPMSPWVANSYACILDYIGRNEEGQALWERLCARWPDNDLIAWNAIADAGVRGDWTCFDRLVAAAGKRGFDSTRLREVLAYCKELRMPGPDVQAGVLIRARQTLDGAGALPHSTYVLLYRLGLADETFELIEQSSFAYMFDPTEPTTNGRIDDGLIFSLLHSNAMVRDVRFVRLCAKLGLCDYWVKSGNWPDCAETVAPCYDFKAEA
ncbi:MAG: winged helix-turn-helix domain-containing tetratricopeptide repeat protein, partial [Rhizomicrobium sp.]